MKWEHKLPYAALAALLVKRRKADLAPVQLAAGLSWRGIGLIVRPEPRERRAELASDILHRSDVLYPWVGQGDPVVVDAWWVQEAAW